MHEMKVTQQIIEKILQEISSQGNLYRQLDQHQENVQDLENDCEQDVVPDNKVFKGYGNSVQVREVVLAMGPLCGFYPESVDFCFSILKNAYKPLAATQLTIENIPLKIKCEQCHFEGESFSLFQVCEACGGGDVKIVSGTEFMIKHLEVTYV